MADPLMRRFGLREMARLHGAFRTPVGEKREKRKGRKGVPEARGELTFVVGTRDDPRVPEFILETLNLVLAPDEATGGGDSTPSACLPGGSGPGIEFDPESNEISAEFELNIDFPAARRQDRELDPAVDTPGPTAVPTRAAIRGRFLRELRPNEFGQESLELRLTIDVPARFRELVELPRLEIGIVVGMAWFRFRSRKQLCIQPVFIAADGAIPPTGSDFYPLLARANEIWAKCCIQFVAKCPPVYVDKQEYRISTAAEAQDFKDDFNAGDAIEVFVVERLDPSDMWGGGATWGSGTGAAKIVTGDNQLPVNRNHLAHELGHVLGLGHPGNALDGLIDGCEGSVMEPSGFYLDNPEFQCTSNCANASNPLLCTVPYQPCIYWTQHEQLF